MLQSRVATLVALVVVAALVATSAFASIENKPVKVTHRNSGPRYEIEDTVDRSKLTPVTENNNQQANNINTDNVETPHTPLFRPIVMQPSSPSSDNTNNDDDQTIGHIAIRRIFLVPMMRPSMPSEEDSAPQTSSSSSSASEQSDEMPSMFSARPRPSFWPFGPSAFPGHQQTHMTSQPQHVHLFGQDTASRPPHMIGQESGASDQRPMVAGGEGERETPMMPQNAGPQAAGGMDPVSMLVDLMRQAINQAVLSPNNFFNPSDLNSKPQDGPAAPSADGPFGPAMPAAAGSDSERKQPGDLMTRPSNSKPATNNESSEEIVEINGKKYIKKAVISRHIGENIVLVTKRLIFLPLNETSSDEASTTTTTTTTTTPISTSTSSASTTTLAPPSTEAASSPSTTTTTTNAEESSAPTEMRKVEEPATTATSTTTTSTSTSTAAPSTTSEKQTDDSTTTTTTTDAAPTSTSSTTTTTTTQAPSSTTEEATTTTTTTTEQPSSSTSTSTTTTESSKEQTTSLIEKIAEASVPMQS